MISIDEKTLKNKIIPIVILTPIGLGLLLNIPTGFLTIGDESAWVGFFGNYSGGIIGGIVAFLIANSQLKEEQEKRKKEESQRKEERENQEKFATTIVQEFLFDEMRINIDRIPTPVLDALKLKLNNQLVTTYIYSKTAKSFEFSTYEEIRFELVKYNNPYIRDTIRFYRALKKFINSPDEINKMKVEDAKFIYDQISTWKTRLDTNS